MEKTGSRPIEHNDSQLVQQALRHDQVAFLKLYERYRTGVFQYVASMVSLREEAEDVVAESFAKAFSQLSAYDPQYHFSTWIYRIARNTALDHLEKSGRTSSNMPTNSIDDTSSGLDTIPALTGNPEVEIISGEDYEKLLCALELLPEGEQHYRTIMRMLLLDNCGYQEIADALQIPLNTARTRIKRGRERLQEIMKTSDELL